MCKWKETIPEIYETSCGNITAHFSKGYPPYKECPFCREPVEYSTEVPIEIEEGNIAEP